MTVLEVSFSPRKQIVPLLIFCLFIAAARLAIWFRIIPLWLGMVVLGVFTAVLLLGIYGMVRSARAPAVLRLDEAGVTVSGASLVPWTDLREVVIRTMKPAWLMSGPWTTVLALMPQPGVSLPGPPHYRGPWNFARELRTRAYGTNLIMVPSTLSASAEQIAEAAASLGGLPIRRIRDRPLRRWLVLLAGALLAGVVVGLVMVMLRSS